MITQTKSQMQFITDTNSVIPHIFLYINDQLQADIYEYRNTTLKNTYFVSYHLQNNIYTPPIQHFNTLEEAKQFLIDKFETYCNHSHIIYHPLYTMGANDGWKGNVPNEQLESNNLYSQGYDSGYQDRIDEYRY